MSFKSATACSLAESSKISHHAVQERSHHFVDFRAAVAGAEQREDDAACHALIEGGQSFLLGVRRRASRRDHALLLINVGELREAAVDARFDVSRLVVGYDGITGFDRFHGGYVKDIPRFVDPRKLRTRASSARGEDLGRPNRAPRLRNCQSSSFWMVSS